MPDSVIIDDGGSTRIKWNNPGQLGDMPKLLSVETQTITSPFSTVRISYQDGDGYAQTLPDIAFNTKVEIFSGKRQSVLLQKVAGNLEISLTGVEPEVEAKQINKQRRYIVSNAGAIEKVKVDGNRIPVYEADPKCMYTSVVLLP